MAHMMTVYKTDNRVLHEVEEMDPGVWIMMTNPTMEESQEVAEKYDIDMVDVRAAGMYYHSVHRGDTDPAAFY